MLRAYKYRMYPNKDQIKKIWRHIGTCRFLYNLSLEEKMRAYQAENKSLTMFDLNNMIPDLKKQYEWMSETNSQSLQAVNRNVETAFKNFFLKKADFPKFKSKKNPVQSFQIPQHYEVNLTENRVKLPKLGIVKTVISRKYTGTLKTATVSATSTGKYFISVLVDDGLKEPEPAPFDSSNTVGIDVGLTSFLVTSDGLKEDNPKYLKNSLARLKHLQRSVARKVKGSNNRRKAVQKVAILHERISNQRSDFLHKHSYKLVSENQAIAVETLNVSSMLKNHCLARSISDVGWSELFRQLEYKCTQYGKTLLKIGQFEPSSKLCSVCGSINRDLTLHDREWTCPDCSTRHDRDINAAINIKKMALQDQNLLPSFSNSG
ncbi:IS200/IS605 family element RNA-guided endonuclease TnpB [Methanosphaerula subterraneus]|uniref:IS200/IS605 family element RNA-guided endonuclease TnpB n=1 Tax=Methanosphaerula subterraneus TaxID=3350244 RepID=UPI003F8740E3